MPDYSTLTKINDSDKKKLNTFFISILGDLKQVSFKKITHYLGSMSDVCKMHHKSVENRKLKLKNSNKHHPIKPKRGEVYNAVLTEGIGSELSGSHLVIIIQNHKGNIYGEKVNAVPIEGDGNSINPNYQLQLLSSDFERNEQGEEVRLHKDPSRIIMTDIITIDKARLQRRIGMLKETKIAEINKKLIYQLELF